MPNTATTGITSPTPTLTPVLSPLLVLSSDGASVAALAELVEVVEAAVAVA